MLTPFFLDRPNARLAGVSAGSGSPVVFLHAGVSDSRLWQDQMSALAPHHRVIAFDRRGFGETTAAPGAFSHLEDLEALLATQQVQRPVLVGCSMGGALALDYALAHPGALAGLVLIGTAISGAPDYPGYPPVIDALEKELQAAEQARDLERVNALEAHLWLDGPEQPEGRVGGAVRALFLDMNGKALAKGSFRDAPRAPAFPRLAEITVPTTVVCGRYDYPDIAFISEQIAAKVPGAQLVWLDSCAHLPSIEAPGQVTALLQDFLRRARPAAR